MKKYNDMKKKTIRVRVITRAAREEIVEIEKDVYKIKIHVAPAGGRANEKIISLLSQTFTVPKSHITIIRGQTSKHKVIEIITEQ